MDDFVDAAVVEATVVDAAVVEATVVDAAFVDNFVGAAVVEGAVVVVLSYLVWPSKSAPLRKSEELAEERHRSSGLFILCCALMCVSAGQ